MSAIEVCLYYWSSAQPSKIQQNNITRNFFGNFPQPKLPSFPLPLREPKTFFGNYPKPKLQLFPLPLRGHRAIVVPPPSSKGGKSGKRGLTIFNFFGRFQLFKKLQPPVFWTTQEGFPNKICRFPKPSPIISNFFGICYFLILKSWYDLIKLIIKEICRKSSAYTQWPSTPPPLVGVRRLCPSILD